MLKRYPNEAAHAKARDAVHRPLDLAALHEVFVLPPSINFYEDRKEQAIACQRVRASVTHYKL